MKREGNKLSDARSAARSIRADGTEGRVTGPAREATMWCTACGAETMARVATDAKRHGHTCPACGKPTGLEVT